MSRFTSRWPWLNQQTSANHAGWLKLPCRPWPEHRFISLDQGITKLRSPRFTCLLCLLPVEVEVCWSAWNKHETNMKYIEICLIKLNSIALQRMVQFLQPSLSGGTGFSIATIEVLHSSTEFYIVLPGLVYSRTPLIDVQLDDVHCRPGEAPQEGQPVLVFSEALCIVLLSSVTVLAFGQVFQIHTSNLIDIFSQLISLWPKLTGHHWIIEGSLEVKLPTIWTDEKQSREEAERRERLEERRSEEKESEERRCRCAKR